MGSRLSGIRHSGRVFHVLNSVLKDLIFETAVIFSTHSFSPELMPVAVSLEVRTSPRDS